ncbi:MAG TPA: NAD(P)H-binding protein [Polyangiales bacterium]
MRPETVLLTGATGFVGTSLYPALVAAGYKVRCATRDPEAAARRQPGRSFVHFDLADPESMRRALNGCQRAVYLIHGMASSEDYVEGERRGALAFRMAAEEAGVERVVYLGGMRPRGPASRHLESRLRTGEILRAGHTPTIELQASMVIGPGSESFRMVRDLAARLPAMILPAWSKTRTQPVAIADVVAALVHALDEPREVTGAFALPGPETLSAREILQRTARLLGHDPRMIGVPFVTPKLSAYWIRWITRADPHIAEELVQGLRIDILHQGPGYWVRMPDHHLTGFDQAVQGALSGEARSVGLGGRALERLIDRLSPKPSQRGAKRSL